MRIEHILSLRADARRPIRVLVVGAGGTGSAITMGLPYLDQALRVWGRFAGLDVVLMDADTVSETNCIRQPFSISDIGLSKATVLVNRINLFWGTSWRPSQETSTSGPSRELRTHQSISSSAAWTAAQRAAQSRGLSSNQTTVPLIGSILATTPQAASSCSASRGTRATGVRRKGCAR